MISSSYRHHSNVWLLNWNSFLISFSVFLFFCNAKLEFTFWYRLLAFWLIIQYWYNLSFLLNCCRLALHNSCLISCYAFYNHFFQPLYVPKSMLHFSHQCSVTIRGLQQNGIRQQGQHLKEKKKDMYILYEFLQENITYYW